MEKRFKVDFAFIPRVIRAKTSKLLASTTRYRGLSQSELIYIFGLSLTTHLLGILTWYLLALSLWIKISFVNVGWVRSSILIIDMLPISFPGLGVGQGTLIFLLQLYGVSVINAVTLSFLLFASIILFGGIGGLLEAKVLFSANRSKS